MISSQVYIMDSGQNDGQIKIITTYTNNVGLKSNNNIIWNGIIQNSTIYALGTGASLVFTWSSYFSCWIIISGIGFSL